LTKYRRTHARGWMVHDDCEVTSSGTERQLRRQAGEWTWQECHMIEGLRCIFRDRTEPPRSIFHLVPWTQLRLEGELFPQCLQRARFHPLSIQASPEGVIIGEKLGLRHGLLHNCMLRMDGNAQHLSWLEVCQSSRKRIQEFQRQEVLHGQYTYDYYVQSTMDRLALFFPRVLCTSILWNLLFFCPRIII